jgi:hypothetical protein
VDVFDAADYRSLLPRKVQRWIGAGILAFAVLAPTRFQTWYIHQAQTHAQHLTDEFVDLLIPTPAEPPATPTSKDHN